MKDAQLRAVIVDDERLSRDELRYLLRAHPEVHIEGEADDVTTAIAVINAIQPDVVFLDVELRGGNSFEVVRGLTCKPWLIFVTGFDTYTERALEVSALDYLLKPVHPDRLAVAIERLLDGILRASSH